MSIVYRLDGALLPYQTVRLQGNDGVANGFPAIAVAGEPGIASVRIDDSAGTLDIDGWHTFTVEETLCSKPRIFTGWIIGRTIDRGPYRTGAGRVWDCQIIDQNAIFGFEVLRSSHDAKRPIETDIVRVQAAIDSGAMSGTPIYDNGRFYSTSPITLSEANFVGQTPAEMIGSVMGVAGKNFYAYWDNSARQISLHYGPVLTGPSASLSISNVYSDVTSPAGGTVYPPFIDAQMESDPSRLATGVLLHYKAGYVYVRNQTLIDAMSPTEFSPSEWRRDFSYSSDRIGSAATANTYANIELNRRSTEDAVLTCTIQVAPQHVNLVEAGDLINVRFSHLPGFETTTQVIVNRRLVQPADGTDALYNVYLEMGLLGPGNGPGGGDPGIFPTPPCSTTLVASDDHDDTASGWVSNGMTLPSQPTEGNVMLLWMLTLNVSTRVTPTGWTAVGSDWQDDPAVGGGHKLIGNRWFYKWATAGESTSVAFTKTGGNERVFASYSEWGGVDTFDGLATWTSQEQLSVDPFIYASATVTAPPNRPAFFICGLMPSLNVNDNWFPNAINFAHDLSKPGEGSTSSVAKGWVGYKQWQSSPTPTETVIQVKDTPASGISRGSSALTLKFSGTCDNSTDPVPGQPVDDPPTTAPGGGTTTGTTEHPYADGSLMVFVDGILQPVQETDPTTGAYTLYFDPRPSEVVTVRYQGR